MAGAKILDINTLLDAGIDPKTGLPLKLDNGGLKAHIKRQLRIVDEQDAVNRYSWYNQILDLSSQEIERLIYYKGQLCLFYHKALEKFYLMPYALDGGLDFYQRFKTVHPVPLSGDFDDVNKDNYLATLKLEVIYDIPLDDEIDFFEGKHCVLLHDYTKQLSQTIVSRQILNESILDLESDLLPFMRTALLSATGVTGVRVNDENESASVEEMSKGLNKAARDGRKFVATVGQIQMQELTGAPTSKSEEFLLAMQGVDNYRLSLYGLSNGGLFQKKSHMLEAEQNMNAGSISVPLQDGLRIRQRFCDIVNALTGAGMSCEISENAIEADMNGDGLIIDETAQTGNPGDQDHLSDGSNTEVINE